MMCVLSSSGGMIHIGGTSFSAIGLVTIGQQAIDPLRAWRSQMATSECVRSNPPGPHAPKIDFALGYYYYYYWWSIPSCSYCYQQGPPHDTIAASTVSRLATDPQQV